MTVLFTSQIVLFTAICKESKQPSVNFSFPAVKKTPVFSTRGENSSFLHSWKTEVNTRITMHSSHDCSSNIHPPLTGITQGVKLVDELGCHFYKKYSHDQIQTPPKWQSLDSNLGPSVSE